MPQTSLLVQTLTEHYPSCAGILRAFAPLEDACDALARSLPAPALAAYPVDQEQVAQGKALYLADKEHAPLFVDAVMVEAAPPLCAVAAQSFPHLAEALAALELFLHSNAKACAHLITLGITGMHHRVAPWAKKHGQHKEATQLMTAHLARSAARRVAQHAAAPVTWTKPHCPICGSSAQAGSLRHKEGQRFLHCGLCGHAWRFSRTTCPVCEDSAPDKRKVFHLEGATPQSRAEGCEVCKHYLLVPDMRDMLDEVPVSLLLYGLIPLDMLMQQQGYAPPPQGGLRS